MYTGSFIISISSKAEKIDIDQINDIEKNILLNGITYDPKLQDAYRFFIVPKINFFKKEPGWKKKKNSFEKVDRVYLQAYTNEQHIQFLGIFPTSCTIEGQWEAVLEGQAFLKTQAPGIGGLKLTGSIKNKIRKESFLVKAYRHNSLAQWFFSKKWIKSGKDFKIQLICLVEKSLAEKERVLFCNAKFANGGDALAEVKNKKVLLPI